MDERFGAIDLGGTQLRVAIADRDLNLSGVVKEAADHRSGPPGIMAQMARMLSASIEASGTPRDAILRCVIACPGPLDTVSGTVHGAPNLPGWEDDVPLRQMAENVLRLSVQPVNDANAAGLGEFLRGAGMGSRNMVFLTVSTGIGGGVVVDGRMLEGSRGMAGEIGHITVDLHGPVCRCGSVGCLEMLASGTAIGRLFREALAHGESSNVIQSAEGREATAADVAVGAQRGDPLASRIWSECMEALGFGVINCIHIFNPDIVVLGGGVTNAGEILFAPVRATVQKYGMTLPVRGVEIVRAKLRDDAGLYGAASLAARGW